MPVPNDQLIIDHVAASARLNRRMNGWPGTIRQALRDTLLKADIALQRAGINMEGKSLEQGIEELELHLDRAYVVASEEIAKFIESLPPECTRVQIVEAIRKAASDDPIGGA